MADASIIFVGLMIVAGAVTAGTAWIAYAILRLKDDGTETGEANGDADE